MKTGRTWQGADQAAHSAPFDQAEEKTGNGQSQKDKEQRFGNADSPGGNATKAKQGGNQGDDKKYDGVVQHVSFLVNRLLGLEAPNLSACASPVCSLANTARIKQAGAWRCIDKSRHFST
jgi:hypothetical protein